MEEEVGFKMAIGMEPLHLTRGTRGGESVKWRGGSFHDRQSNSNVRTHLQGWYDFGKKQKLCGLTASSHGHVIALNAVSWWHGLGPQDAQIALGGGGSGSSDGRVALPCHPLLGKLGHRPVAGTGQHLVLPAAAFALRDKHAEVADGVPIRPHPPPGWAGGAVCGMRPRSAMRLGSTPPWVLRSHLGEGAAWPLHFPTPPPSIG